MKIIGVFLINLVAYTLAAQEITVNATIEKVERQINKWLLIVTAAEDVILSTTVQKPITNEADLAIEYKVVDKSDKVLGEGSGPLCTHPKSKDGLMVHLMGKFLGINLECPVREKTGDRPLMASVLDIALDEKPEEMVPLCITLSIKEEGTTIVTLTLMAIPL
ncbi:uncharacterized protein LOC135160615 [Diachasmimorpha longicaudata]|uniref:uncharacterized protein LOC135160615 n=1 Tax=Diachasmimorpha longicaudata TaxID=58733 RepID=UPI0030B8FA6C